MHRRCNSSSACFCLWQGVENHVVSIKQEAVNEKECSAITDETIQKVEEKLYLNMGYND